MAIVLTMCFELSKCTRTPLRVHLQLSQINCCHCHLRGLHVAWCEDPKFITEDSLSFVFWRTLCALCSVLKNQIIEDHGGFCVKCQTQD